MNTIDAKLEAKRNSFENLLRGAVTRASDKAWENCDYVACDKIQKIKERLVLSIQRRKPRMADDPLGRLRSEA